MNKFLGGVVNGVNTVLSYGLIGVGYLALYLSVFSGVVIGVLQAWSAWTTGAGVFNTVVTLLGWTLAVGGSMAIVGLVVLLLGVWLKK